MEKIKKGWGWFWVNLGNIALVGGWVMSLTVPPWVWSLTEQAKPFHYLIAAALGAVTFALIRMLWYKGAQWRFEARLRRRLSDVGSPFNPMAKVFEDKQLYLRDLIPVGRNGIQGRTFINCEIIGPGTAKILTRSEAGKPWPSISDSRMFFTDCVESDPDVKTENAVFFPDCNFIGCHFYNMTLLFDHRVDGPGWNWISRDSRQPILPDQSEIVDEPKGK